METKQLNLRIPKDLHEQISRAARADDRSLNSWILRNLRKVVQGNVS